MSTAYSGSQAPNQMFLINEYVNKNSGSLTLNKPIVSLKGVNQHIGLKISLVYSANQSGNGILGLPLNWSWNVSYVFPGLVGTVSAQGKTGIIDVNWSDNTGYQSGIKYLNDHGVKFESIIPEQPVPGRPTAYFGYKYSYSDGAVEYFDATGKLLQHSDIFGNAINYFYNPEGGTVEDCWIDHIIDSFGQITNFSYGPNAIYITTPDGRTSTILYSSNGVSQIVDPLNNKTIVQYISQSGYSVVNLIQYPTGLRTILLYTSINYFDESGNTSSFPAISQLTHVSETGSFLSQTNYAYGLNTAGNTYTGYNSGYTLGPTDDGLMESNNIFYRYDVLITKLDLAGNIISASRVFYNYLHVPMNTVDYLVDSKNNLINAYQTEYTYLVQPNIYARMANFNRPITTIQSVWSDSGYIPLKKSAASYDYYGQALSTEEWIYDRTLQDFVLQVSEEESYVVTSWGGEMPLSVTYTDYVQGVQKKIDYALTSDQKSIQSGSLKYRAKAETIWNPWKTKLYSYDSMGRLTELSLEWSPGSSPFPGSVLSSTETYDYAYDDVAHELTVSLIDPNNKITKHTYDMTFPNGPVCLLEGPSGSLTKYTYDGLGRRTSHTDPNGNITTISYQIYDTDGMNAVTTIMPDSYVVQALSNALEQIVQISDNGNPTTTISSSANRILRTKVYNEIGLLSASTDALGTSDTYIYDGLGRMVQHVDSMQNLKTIKYDDSNLTTEIMINGILQQITVKNGIGKTIELAIYPDPNSDVAYYHQTLIEYNGFGKKIRTQLNQIAISDNSIIKELKTQSFTYDPDLKIIDNIFSGFLGIEEVSMTRQNVYELQNHLVTYNKTINYSTGGNYSQQGGINQFNAAGQLVSYTNQISQTELYEYDANGKLSKMIRFDKSEFKNQYDANGNLIEMSWENGSRRYAYNSDNKITSVIEGKNTMEYVYYLDGSLQEVTFPDGCTQVYVLDAFSRIISQTDASGNLLTNEYNSFSQMAKRSYQGDVLTFNYGVVNGINASLISVDMAGKYTYTRKFKYDGFGQSIGKTIEDNVTIILNEDVERDALGRTTKLQLHSGRTNVSPLNLTKTFNYDGLNQLRQEKIDYADSQPSDSFAFDYDGNSNVLIMRHNEKIQSFSYNAIDQLEAPNTCYDLNGRLTQDAEGKVYIYNDLDHLVSVTSNKSNNLNKFNYYPDNALGSSNISGHPHNFYYDSGAVNAISFQSNNSSDENIQLSQLTKRTANLSDNDWTTFLISPEQRESAYSANENSYYHVSNRSTALLNTGTNDISFKYAPYGLNETSNATNPTLSFFWNQEYYDLVTDLVYLRARFYDTRSMRFLTMDSSRKDNLYSFGNADPVNNYDPTGHSAILGVGAALALSAVVGIAATVATGGVAGAAAAQIFGAECVLASIAVGAVSGAAGSVAGDASLAGLSGEKYTGKRAMIDLATGAVGGAVGAGVGSAAGKIAMNISVAEGLSKMAMDRISAISAGISGGFAGSLASAGITSGAYRKPFFSESTAIGLAVGAIAGGGGALLGSGAVSSLTRKDYIPVPVEPNEFNTIRPAGTFIEGTTKGWLSFVKFGEHDSDMHYASEAMHINGDMWDTVDIHGGKNGYMIRTIYHGEEMYRPISQKNFGKYLSQHASSIGGTDNTTPLKLLSCQGAFSNARALANALQRPVFGSYSSMSVDENAAWVRFDPK